MLTGEYRHSIDSKNRLFIPAKHREELGENFIIARDFRQKCLKAYSAEKWKEHISDLTRGVDGAKKEELLRFFHRDAIYACPDSQGRVILTPSLMKHADITKSAVIVGCSDYAEIWSDENYDELINNEDADAIREYLERMGL